jgi:hypothetical protein
LKVGFTVFSMLMLAPAQKNFSPAPAQHDHVHVLVEARLQDGVVEVAHHLVGVGVRRRIGELDPGHGVLDAIVDELGLGGFHGFLRAEEEVRRTLRPVSPAPRGGVPGHGRPRGWTMEMTARV